MFHSFFILILVIISATEAHSLRGKNGKSSNKYKSSKKSKVGIQLGPRPYYLVQSMADSPLKEKLEKCAWEKKDFEKSDWSISHRGAPVQYPEHTLIGYEAGIRMGAGVIECDVTFTKDLELVCRHAQCDLHTTTDVLLRPELAAKCTHNWPNPKCCASDFTLAEIRSLCAKMDASGGTSATSVEEYVNGGVAPWRTTIYAQECPRVPTHKEYIELGKRYGVKFTPELKTPEVVMPFNGFSQEDYAQKMIDEYIDAGVGPSDVYQQSFLWSDTIYWVKNTDYENAVALEGNYDSYTWSAAALEAYFQPLVDAGVSIVAPPMWMLNELDGSNQFSLSTFATVAKSMGMDIITWTLERDGPLKNGGAWYYTGMNSIINSDGDKFEFLEFLRTEVDIRGIFSDWPATVTFFANCMKA